MSKERLLKILHKFHEDNNWLCYEYDKDLNGFHLYENGNKMAKFVLDNYGLVMINGTDIPPYCRKVIRVAIAKYIVQEEELRNKKFYLKMKISAIGASFSYLNYISHIERLDISSRAETDTIKTLFTESDIEKFKEEFDGFDELLELCEREYVED